MIQVLGSELRADCTSRYSQPAADALLWLWEECELELWDGHSGSLEACSCEDWRVRSELSGQWETPPPPRPLLCTADISAANSDISAADADYIAIKNIPGIIKGIS